PMLRTVPLLAALPLLAVVGVAEGLWTNRWGPSADLDAASARLADLPLNVGEWEGQVLELDQRQGAQAGMHGYLMRAYVHRETGSSLRVLIICGRPGPVAIHTPDVCYGGAGFVLTDGPAREALAANAVAPSPQFWSARFKKQKDAQPEQLRIRWAWTADGAWQAPDNPRLKFVGSSHLYKIYLIHRITGLEEHPEEDPTEDSLRAFLPQLQGQLQR